MKKGFTLIEVMIVAGVVATLAVVAIPQYNNYIARAQVTEGILALEFAKNVVTEEYATNGTFPRTELLKTLIPQNTTSNLRSTRYLNLITTDQSSGNKNYDINLRFKKEGLSSQIADKHLTFRYNYVNKIWSCISEDIKQSNLPQACKGI